MKSRGSQMVQKEYSKDSLPMLAPSPGLIVDAIDA